MTRPRRLVSRAAERSVGQMSATPPSEAETHADVSVALRNAVKLGLSLMATWAVALGVRFILPRHLTVDQFGAYSWAESTAGLAFVFAGLGLDTYIQREVSVRPEHASDFFGGVLLVRALVMSMLLAGVAAYAAHAEPDRSVQLAVIVFGLTQVLVVTNASLAALLQASTKVAKLAVANVLTKLVWGVGVIVVVRITSIYALLALPLLAGEVMKSAMLWPAVKKEIGLRLRVNRAQTRAVLILCVPFFVNTISYTMGNKLDVTMLRSLSSKEEVGFYSAAQNIASLAMLLAPLEAWVITPLLTRAVKRSEDEFFVILRRAIEGILIVAVPATMMISLGADFWMKIAVGAKYAPGAPSLAQLAPSFVFTYAAVLLATALIILGRSWTVTLISLVRLALQPILMLVVVPYGFRNWGVGGAGMADALVFTTLELFAAAMFLAALGRRAFDRRLLFTVFKSMLAFAAAFATHKLLEAIGPWRLLVDALVYAMVILGSRGVTIGDIRWVLSMVRNRKSRA